MLKIPGYKILQALVERSHVLVARAYSEALGHNVVLKILRSEFPTPAQIACYENEFALLQHLHHEGIPQAYALFTTGKMRVLVLEDIDGQNLALTMKTRSLTITEKVWIAIAATKALGSLHAEGIIHRDIKPENIVLANSFKRLQLADFGLARKADQLTADNTLSGTLHYIAPEQTGRTRNPVDYRSDYYSLGATLYELFSGVLPFIARDEMEWVHNHIAVQEMPLHERDSRIPLAVSRIVQKLMRKNPEDRYQSSLGLLRDLESCLNEDSGDEFRAGRMDVSAELRLPTKLYGRDEEIKIVNRVLAKTIMGERRMLLVDGAPGIGKSSLANIVKETVRDAGGYFIFGKFDQYRKDVPFSALIQAFNQLVTQILTEDESRILAWKERILAAMGENAAIVTDILPQMELIIGKMPAVELLDANEQRVRFQQTFQAFLRACSQRGRPLAIFLDDLQWADSASRSVIRTFMYEDGAESLLVIAAYRDSEVTPGHPLRQLLEEMVEKKIDHDTIHLAHLNLSDVTAFVADTFPHAKSDGAGLAALVHQKTNGNPFFVSQFIKALLEKRLLHFDPLGGWDWDLEKIRNQEVTTNVLELLTERIGRLPEGTVKLIELAACFGAYFHVGELKSYNQKTDAENSLLLQPAIDAGLISPSLHDSYKFIHDRVQEAAYKLMRPYERAQIHYRIAQHLLSLWTPEKVREGIFYLVNHLNSGQECLRTETERIRAAELNQIAAERARDSSVYDVAYGYAVNGISLVGGEWSKFERILKPLTLLKAHCEFAIGKYDDCDESFKTMLSKTTAAFDKAKVYREMIDIYHIRDENHQAIDLGFKALDLLGVKIPRKPSALRVLATLLLARRYLQQRLRGEVAEREGRPDSEQQALVLKLLESMAAASYTTNKKLLAFVCLRSVMISMRAKYMDFSPRTLLTVYLWYILGDFKTTSESVDQLLKHLETAEIDASDARGLFGLQCFSMHLVRPLRETIRALERTVHLLSLQGDILYTTNTHLQATILRIMTERSLEHASTHLDAYLKEIRKKGEYGVASYKSFKLMVNTWRGLSEPGLDDASVDEYMSRLDTPVPPAWREITRMVGAALMGDYRRAFDAIDKYEWGNTVMPFPAFPVHARFFAALVRYRNFDRLSRWARFKQMREIRQIMRTFKKLSMVNPQNFLAPALILEGQKHFARGRYLAAMKATHAAIAAARKGEIVFYEPLACELLAEIYFKQGLSEAGALQLQEALYLYETWGAKAKVEALRARYPDIGLRVSSERREKTSLESVTHTSVQSLDLNTVLKATNTLISEIDMSRLVQKLLNILIENAGAERGVLFLREGPQLFARGEISVKTPGEFQLTNIQLDAYKGVPHAMLAYVSRTHENMVIEDATHDDRLSRDEYVQRNQARSTVCFPILSQGELRGLVYLENNASKGVFSPARVELMRILSGQIAISLENANLYQRQAETIRMQNELVTAHAVQEMLFPPADFSCPGAAISGFYKPATECGGDWWSYSKIGDWVYCYVGDATGHGAPAALVTSAACSAVSVIESSPGITPEGAMSLLNKAVHRATKGQITMTFFIGALNTVTGEFRYVRASHEPAFLLSKEKLENGTSLRTSLEPLMGTNGTSLGEDPDESYVPHSLQLHPGDTVVFYTDGMPDIVNKDGQVLGERGFLEAVLRGCRKEKETTGAVAAIVEDLEGFRNQQELRDDLTICVLRYTGDFAAAKRAA